MACRILVPRPGIEPGPLAVDAWSPNHWVAREFPDCEGFDGGKGPPWRALETSHIAGSTREQPEAVCLECSLECSLAQTAQFYGS